MGILAATIPGPNLFSGTRTELSLGFYTTSVLLSTTLTCLVCYRLLHHARTVKECLGGQFASPYFTTVTFIVESVLPCTLTGIAFLVSFGVMSQVWMAFWCMYTSMLVRCCSPVCESINGADRFVVYVTADVDLACGRENSGCVADRHSEGASIGDKDISGR
jgi:hypothetical protein